MVEPVSILGLIAAIPPLTKPIVEYISMVRGASEEVRDLARELRNFQDVLENLGELLQAEELSATSALYQSTGEVLIRLAQLRASLEKQRVKLNKGARKLVSSLSWPYKKLETQRIVDMLRMHTQLFNLTLAIDGHRSLSRTSSELKDDIHNRSQSVLDVQEDVRQAIDNIPDRVSTEILEDLRQIQKLSNISIDLREIESHRKAVAREISSFDFRSKQREHYNESHPKTGQLLKQTTEFQAWYTGSKPSALWCWGNPGCGKSVVTSSVIQQIYDTMTEEEGQDIAVVYVYCDYKDSATHSALPLLHSLCRQLVEQTNRAQTILDTKEKQERMLRKNRDLTFQEVMTQLCELIRDFDQVYVFFDALDELPESCRDRLLDGLAQLEDKVYLFLTSRPNIDPRPKFRDLGTYNIQADWEDVRAYMDSEIDAHPRLGRLISRNPSLKKVILDGVYNMSSGIFLLARLQIENLSKQDSSKSVLKAMQNFGSNVSAAYDSCLRRIGDQDERDRKLAMRVFSIVCCARRPLEIKELLSGLAVDPEDDEIDEGGLQDLETILEVSDGLVSVSTDEDDLGESHKTLRLVHFSLQEYFETRHTALFPNMQLDMSRICLAFLNSDYRPSSVTSGSEEPVHSFLQYACVHWHYHLLDVQTKVLEQAVHFLEQEEKRERCKFELELLYELESVILVQDICRSPLHVASFWGLNVIVQELLQRKILKVSINQDKGPLHLAIINHKYDTVRLLLDHGADANHIGIDPVCPTPMHTAAISGSLHTCLLLLERGAQVNSTASWTPLKLAIKSGEIDVVKLLIEKGANLAPSARGSSTALDFAKENGQPNICQLLLDAEAESRMNHAENMGSRGSNQ